MSGHVCICSWPCSYYLDLEKRWVPGHLSLLPHSLRFTAERAGEVLVGVPLSSIVAIRKEASHFIFSAITVLEKGHLKHWFSSLRPSRNAVFHVLEHFWRELLLSQPGAAAEVGPSPTTRGQELTGLMASSQRRLEDTARVLHHQGKQLDSVMKGLEKMDSDLDVADRWVNPETALPPPESRMERAPCDPVTGRAQHLEVGLCVCVHGAGRPYPCGKAVL